MRYPVTSFFGVTSPERFPNPNSIYVELEFDEVANVSHQIAVLPYDKQKAFSFRFDDGHKSSYLNYFSLIFGTKPDSGGNVHTGRFYTDGCGNNIMFASEYGFMPVNDDGSDAHLSSPTYLTWDEIKFMRDFGSTVFYQQYGSPLDYTTFTTVAQYANDHQQAVNMFYNKLGLTVRGTSNNNGDQRFSSFLGECPWQNTSEMYLMTRASPAYIGSDTIYPEANGWRLDTLTKAQLTSKRIAINAPYLTFTATNTIQYWKDRFTDFMNAEGNRFHVMFLHGAGYDLTTQDQTYSSMSFLVDFTQWIQTNYGKDGLDNILIATSQDIYEYQYCRLNSKVIKHVNGKKVMYEIIPPENFVIDHPNLTLKISCSQPVKSFNIHNVDRYSSNLLNQTSGIININWSNRYNTCAVNRVVAAEASRIPYDIAVAQYAVGLLTIPSKHDPLQTRLNNIVPLEYKAYLTDFGYNGVGYDTPSPWNNIRGANGSSANGAFVENLRATDYSSSNITITLGTNLLFSATGVTSTGNDSGAYPDKAIRDCIETSSNAEGLVTISGLTPGVQYKFKIHGGRQYLDDTTRYTIQVDGSSDTTVLTLYTKNNTLNTVETPYLTVGATGIVTIKLKNTLTNKAYLNVLEIREKL